MTVGYERRGPARANALSKIPPFPPIAVRLLQVLRDDGTPIDEIAELIRADPALSSALLRRANSPLYGFISQISSLDQALFLLGLQTAKNLAVTLATGGYAAFGRSAPERQRCWRHTLACALLAEEVARASSLPADQAYTAGLLHDIGRLGLLVAFPKEYAALLKSADEVGNTQDSAFLLDREREVFELDHCEAGRRLAEQWGLPDELAAAAGRHHDRAYGEFNLLALVQLSCKLADTLGFHVIHEQQPVPFEKIRDSLPEAARARFWHDARELRKFIDAKMQGLDAGPVSDTAEQAKEPSIALSGLPDLATKHQESSTPAAERKEQDLSLFRDIPDSDLGSSFRDVLGVFLLGLVSAVALLVFFYCVHW
jgi:putative nucleotidyltransferase with HDIG domain